MCCNLFSINGKKSLFKVLASNTYGKTHSLKCVIWATLTWFRIDLSHQFAIVLSTLKNQVYVKRNLEWERSSYAMDDCFSYLIHFSPMSHFYTPWKRQKIYGFLTFSGGIEMWHWINMGLREFMQGSFLVAVKFFENDLATLKGT